MYGFDYFPDRRNTGSLKWDAAPEGVLPMWVAEMDISIAPPIEEAILSRAIHPLFGYSDEEQEELKEIVAGHYERKYQVRPKTEWIVWIPSVMPGLTTCCKMQGGSFIYSIPMYNHIRMLTEETRQKVVEVPLQRDGQYRFTMDFDALERALTPEVKTFILCNPHNPVGRVYTREELEQVVDFCEKHGLLLASDEIHGELALHKPHIPMFSLSERAANISVTVASAGKICNIPGLPMGFAIIPNPKLRERFVTEKAGTFPAFNVLTLAAYRKAFDGSCDGWKEELRRYLSGNLAYLEERVEAIPGLHMPHNEGTYLAWLDCRELGLDNPGKYFLENAAVMMSGGEVYGDPQCVRLNYGCPRSQLTEVLDRIEAAVRKIR